MDNKNLIYGHTVHKAGCSYFMPSYLFHPTIEAHRAACIRVAFLKLGVVIEDVKRLGIGHHRYYYSYDSTTNIITLIDARKKTNKMKHFRNNADLLDGYGFSTKPCVV
jgi:hypothetical protein